MTRILFHRVNTIEGLAKVPDGTGVEIDIRGYGEKMLLNHDPVLGAEAHDDLESYLQEASNKADFFFVFNMKEAGYEQRVIDLAKKYAISSDRYFLLDVEFPYLYRATRKEGVRQIAVRYSEAEPIEAVEAQMTEDGPLLDWVWIDTNTTLPLDAHVVERLKPFKTCLVSPDRWGRPEDIESYAAKIKELGMRLDAVMTGAEYADTWNALLND